MDINQPKGDQKGDKKQKEMIFSQSLADIDTKYSTDLELEKKFKKSQGVLSDSLNQENMQQSAAENAQNAKGSIFLFSSFAGLIILNAITYPRLLKAVRRLFNRRKGKKMAENFYFDLFRIGAVDGD